MARQSRWQVLGALLFALFLVVAPASTATAAMASTPQSGAAAGAASVSAGADTAPASNDPPEEPEAYYGNVTINGQPAPVGTNITARINGTIRGQITVTEEGKYGDAEAFEDKLTVNGTENGSTVRFFVDGVDTNQTDLFQAGTVTQLNLSINKTVGNPPTARFNFSPSSPAAGATVTFNASNSTDNGTIEAYNWDFDGDGNRDATGETVTHTFGTPGQKSVTLTVRDDTNEVDRTTKTVNVTTTEGTLLVDPDQAFATATTLRFELTDVSGTNITSYRWDFDDGTTNSTAGDNTTHVFGTSGTYNVSVRGLNDGQLVATANATVEVGPPPELTASPSSGLANLTEINFTFSVPGGTIDADEYRWDFDGDGTVDRSTNPNSTSTVYEQSGTFDATVRAINDGSVIAEVNTTVEIQQAEGTMSADPVVAYANSTVVDFTTQNTTPIPPDEIFAYRWDFNGDGTTDNETTDNDTRYVYGQPGTYTATVRAIGGPLENVLYRANTDVTVRRASGDLVSDEQEVFRNSSVNFTVTNVTPGVTPTEYRWDFDGDGTVDNTTSANSTAHVFEDDGNYTVTVRAYNANGFLFAATTEVSVLGPDVSVELTVPAEQRIRDGVFATVNVTNQRSIPAENVTVELRARGQIAAQRDKVLTNRTNVTLAPNSSRVYRVNLTQWAYADLAPHEFFDAFAAGRIDLRALADSENELDEDNEVNNRATNETVATFSDLETFTDVTYRGVINESQTITVTVENDGTAATTSQHTIDVTFGDGNSTTITVPPLQPSESNRTTVTYTYTRSGDFTVQSVARGDRLYPSNNASSDDIEIQEFDFDVENVYAPFQVENGSTFTVWVSYDTNIPSEVNLSIELPPELELAQGENRNKTDQSSSWGGWKRWEVRAVEATEPNRTTIDVTARSRGRSDNASDETKVIIPKIRVQDTASGVISNDSSSSNTVSVYDTTANTTITVRNETTFEHSFTIVFQGSAEGRTLEGLEYLFNYPYGCVEQTTSPMLAALYTDQYYTDSAREPPSSYDREKTNNTITGGLKSLSNGSNAQHANGAWSMWGNDPDGDLFYTMYAYFGTTAIRNDEDQSLDPENRQYLNRIDFNATVSWIRSKQDNDTGRIRSDGYFLDDDESMTGFALIALSQANGTSSTSSAAITPDNLNDSAGAKALDIRQDGARFLVNEQQANGSWNDNAKTTGLALWALQLAKDQGLQNATLESQVNDSIENATAWLIDRQEPDGSWVEDRGAYWSSTGTTTTATSFALTALNATGIPNTNDTIARGLTWLVSVYEQDGSWGYTRASAQAIRTLQDLGQGLGVVNRTVTVEIQDDDGTITVTREVNASEDIVRVELTDSQLARLRNGSRTKAVNISSPGRTGVVVVALENDQVVAEREYVNSQTQALGFGTQDVQNADIGTLGAIAAQNTDLSISLAETPDMTTGTNETLVVTVENDAAQNVTSPIIEIPLTGEFSNSTPLSAVVEETGNHPTIEIGNSTVRDGDAIFVYPRTIPRASIQNGTRTVRLNISVPTPGEVNVTSEVRPMYNESLAVNTTRSFQAEGVGTVNVEVVDQTGSLVESANVSIGGRTIAANATSLEVTTGMYAVSATVGSMAFPEIPVPIAAFGEQNVTFTLPPDDLILPAVIVQTADGVSVNRGSMNRRTLQSPNATTRERRALTFTVDTPGVNATTIVALNESIERAFRARGFSGRTVSISAGDEVIDANVSTGSVPSALQLNLTGDGTVTIRYTGYKLGDANGDGAVNATDAQDIAANIAEGTPDATGEYGDVNQDGSITVVDAMLIAQYDAGNREPDYQRR